MFTTAKAWVFAITAATLIGGIGLYIHGAERAKAQVIVLTAENEKLLRKNQTAQVAISACMGVNLENYLQREKEKSRADKAVADSATRDSKSDDEVTQIRNESTQFGNADCPALDGDFRDWVRGK